MMTNNQKRRMPHIHPGLGLLAFAYLWAQSSCASCPANVIPDQAKQHVHFCAQYLEQGELESAEARCRLAIEFAPRYAEPWNQLGMIEIARGHLPLAREYFKNALSLKNDFPEALNNMGFVYLQERDYPMAADLFKQALEIDPGYQVARRNYATTLMYTGEKEQAKYEYQKCVEIDPNFCDCRIGLGVLALGQEKWNEAKSHFQKTTEVCPDIPEGHYNLCWALFKMGRCALAIDACTRALALNPEYLEARQNLSQAYECLALQDGAIKKMLGDLKENPMNPDLHFRLGSIYEQQQLYERSADEYLLTIQLNPDLVIAYFRAAQVFDKLLKAPETIDMCQKFIDRLRDPKLENERKWCVNRVKELQYK